jgi:hypothetical protein
MEALYESRMTLLDCSLACLLAYLLEISDLGYAVENY